MEARPERKRLLPRAQPRREPRHAGVLQVLQLLCRQRPRACWRSLGSRRAAAGACASCCRSASRSTRSRSCPTRSRSTAARSRARRDFLDFATFVCFFPQLVAGPIERASRLLPQVEQPRTFSWALARVGRRSSSSGATSRSSSSPTTSASSPTRSSRSRRPGFTCSGPASSRSAIQIYADFSAYSDIARGTARWLGFDLMRNFNHPYLAHGPGGLLAALAHLAVELVSRLRLHSARRIARRSRADAARNVLVTFLLSGLWHGASWNYVLWGGYHGLAARHRAPLRRRRRRRPAWRARSSSPFQIVVMFVLVNVGWLMFRETDTAISCGT